MLWCDGGGRQRHDHRMSSTTNQYVCEKGMWTKIVIYFGNRNPNSETAYDSNIVINNNNNTINPDPNISGICVAPNISHFVGSKTMERVYLI